MNTATLEQFRRHLIARRASLLQRWRQAITDEKEILAEREIDWQDAATAAAAAAVFESIGERERRALARIQSSLTRIERGTYDECAVCHREIDEARLRALPETDRCVACAPALN